MRVKSKTGRHHAIEHSIKQIERHLKVIANQFNNDFDPVMTEGDRIKVKDRLKEKIGTLDKTIKAHLDSEPGKEFKL